MISKEERAELRELTKAADGEWRVLSPGELVFANDATNWAGSTEREEYTVLAIAAVNAMPVLLDTLDAADERIAGLEAELGKLKGRNCDDANHGLTMTHQCVACSRIENCEERIAQLESWGREDCGPLKARIAELEDTEEARIAEEKRQEADFYTCEECGERRHKSNGGTDDEACDQCVDIRGLSARIAELEAAAQSAIFALQPTWAQDHASSPATLGRAIAAHQESLQALADGCDYVASQTDGYDRIVADPMVALGLLAVVETDEDGDTTYKRVRPAPIPALPEGGA